MKITEWIKAHPWETGGIVLVGGLGVLFLLNSGGSSGSGSNDASTSAYFQAESAQAQAGDALQETQINAQASTAQALINANASENINSTWAGADVSQAQITGATQISLAPFAAESNVADALASVANAPPLTSTSTVNKNNSGFFGIGASKSSTTTTTETANPAAQGVEAELTGLLHGFNVSH